MDLTKDPTAGGATAAGLPVSTRPEPTSPQSAPPPATHPAASYPGTAPPPSPPGSYRPTQMAPESQVTWSTLAHLSWIVGSFLGGLTFLGPVIAWFALKERGAFVRHHTAEALNAHLSYLIYTVVLGAASGLFTVITFGVGFPTLLAPGAVAVAGIVFSIVAAVSASRGQWYRYPLVIRFVA